MKNIYAGVIILNYIAYNETINCVNDFKKQEQADREIVYIVVDNCSTNNSYEILCNTFKNDNSVFIIKTNINIGFSKGNNYGYSFLKENFNYKFVIFSNDDILLPQKGLYNWIDNSFDEFNFGLLGPDIYSIKGCFHQSPMENETTSIIKCNLKIIKLKIKIIILWFLARIKKGYKKKANIWKNSSYNEVCLKKTLHGSFIIMSHIYLDNYSNPFDERTFLYMEEDILKIRCDKKNIKIVYNPNYCLNHLQAVSTDAIVKDWYIKQIFRTKNVLNSMKIYKNVLKGK